MAAWLSLCASCCTSPIVDPHGGGWLEKAWREALVRSITPRASFDPAEARFYRKAQGRVDGSRVRQNAPLNAVTAGQIDIGCFEMVVLPHLLA